MDSLPDIDINSGIVIGEGDERNFLGEISVEGVEFTYQMRPNNKVRGEREANTTDVCFSVQWVDLVFVVSHYMMEETLPPRGEYVSIPSSVSQD